MKKLLTLGILLLMVTSATAAGKKNAKFLLIAHRGGVVNDTLSENSLKALEEAIRRGYTHVEVDLRMTKDGYVVCSHDGNLLRETGVNIRIADLTLEELKQIRLRKSQEPLPTFEEVCQRSAGRINIMVDPKGASDEEIEPYVRQIDQALSKYDLMKEALFICNRIPLHNQNKVLDWFLGRARTCWRYTPERTRILCNVYKNAGDYHFIFNSPSDFTKEKIDLFHKWGLKVIASVNVAHYQTGDPIQQGEADVRKMLEWGVDGLQIDSCYDPVVFEYLNSH